MQTIRDLFLPVLEDNMLQTWLISLSTLVFVFLALLIARSLIGGRMKALAAKTKNKLDDALVEAIIRTKSSVLFILSAWFASQWLVLPDSLKWFLDTFAMFVLIVQAALWATAIIGEFVTHFVRLQVEGESTQTSTSTALTFVGKLAIWSLAFLLLLENFGFDVTALIASLGIGGIAIALAAQNVLGDLFASLSILFDKPFIVGDFIIVGDLLGTVEKVGLKTTRVRSLFGEQLIFSNNDLLNSRIKNYKRMQERRVVFKLGVTYQTPSEKLEIIPQIVRETVEHQDKVRFDRSHFQSYGDFALIFETVYWVLNPDYNLYMDIQQKINLEIFSRFEKEEIEFAYPTQTVHLLPANGSPSGE